MLPGFTAELSIPGFRFFTLGAYAYIDRSKFEGEEFGARGTSFQVTPSWSVPFKLGRASFVFDGFADYIGAHGELEHQFLAQPQLKVDASPLWGREGKLFVGVEWQVWQNKYGVRGLDESVPQALVLWNP
jgi:nucleoside-specific outer membrane channel protein Tsx